MVVFIPIIPGFAGQSFVPSALENIRALKQEIRRQNLDARIEVDGGVKPSNAREKFGFTPEQNLYKAPEKAR